MRAILRYWQSARAARTAVGSSTRARDVWVVGIDGTRVRSRPKRNGRADHYLYASDPGFEEMCREYETFKRLAREAPRRSLLAAAEVARKQALLDDLVENDETYKSFAHFKAWRAELDQP